MYVFNNENSQLNTDERYLYQIKCTYISTLYGVIYYYVIIPFKSAAIKLQHIYKTL